MRRAGRRRGGSCGRCRSCGQLRRELCDFCFELREAGVVGGGLRAVRAKRAVGGERAVKLCSTALGNGRLPLGGVSAERHAAEFSLAEREQGDLDRDARLRRPAQLLCRLVEPREHLHDRFARPERCLLFQHIFGLGVEVEPLDRAGRLIDHEAPEMQLELGDDLPQVLAVAQQLGDEVQHVLRLARGQCLRHAVDPAVADEAEHFLHLRLRHAAIRKRDALVEDRERVAQAAVRLQRDEFERLVIGLRLHLVADVAQPPLDFADRDAAEIKALAARLNRRRHFVRLRRREDEHDMRGRLFERLQERVERLGRQHVHLVDDVDLVAALGGRELHRLAQAADLVDAAVRCRVDFEDVHGRAIHDALAALAFSARVWRRALLAVQRHRENLRRARLARAAWPGEKVGVADTPRRDGLRKRARDMVLPDEVAERMRPPFAIECDVRHDALLS